MEDLLLEEELSESKEAEDSDQEAAEPGVVGGTEANMNDVQVKDQGDSLTRESSAQSKEEARGEERKKNPDKTLPQGDTQSREKPADRILRHLRTLNKSTVGPKHLIVFSLVRFCLERQ